MNGLDEGLERTHGSSPDPALDPGIAGLVYETRWIGEAELFDEALGPIDAPLRTRFPGRTTSAQGRSLAISAKGP